MEKPTITILKGRNKLNDWIDMSFIFCNKLIITLSIFGYGLELNWIIKDSIGDFVDNMVGEE